MRNKNSKNTENKLSNNNLIYIYILCIRNKLILIHF